MKVKNLLDQINARIVRADRRLIMVRKTKHDELLAVIEDLTKYCLALPLAEGQDDAVRTFYRCLWLQKVSAHALTLAKEMHPKAGKRKSNAKKK